MMDDDFELIDDTQWRIVPASETASGGHIIGPTPENLAVQRRIERQHMIELGLIDDQDDQPRLGK